MKKNVVISMLGVVLVVQSVIFWGCKSSAETVAAITPPEQGITDTAASALAIAAETQNQFCCDAPSEIVWLREHLEKTICILEKKYQLEPLASRLPESNLELKPLVTPYEPPDCHALGLDTDGLKTSIGLQKLAAKMDLSTKRASMMNNSMNVRIENYSKRLQRLEPLLEQD